MGTDLWHVVGDVLRAAVDAEPLLGLGELRPRLGGPARDRLPKAAALLRARPCPETVELFLEILIERTRREIGSRIALRRAFADEVGAITEDTLRALPLEVRDSLGELAYLALRCDSGIPVHAPEAFAHAIRTRGKRLVSAIAQALGVERDDLHTVAECRREMMRSHPDRGGDREVFELWHQRYERARRIGA